jgi:hypothetical protein
MIESDNQHSLFENRMGNKKSYTQDDLNELSTELIKFITTKYEELNKDKSIARPTDQEIKEFLESIIENLTGGQCLATYISGKHKGDRCQAAPHPGSKYCLKHRSQDPDIKNIFETDQKTIMEAIDFFKKAKLNEQ